MSMLPKDLKLWKAKDKYEPYPDFSILLKQVEDSVGNIEKLNDDQLRRLAEKKADILRLQRSSPILFYKPYESAVIPGRFPQDEFHRATQKIKMFIGGNRSGKSEAGAMEACWTALGIHPYIKPKKNNKGWIVSLDFPMSRDVAEVKIHKWFPSSEIIKWDKQNRILYHNNGEIRFRSCDQDIQTFGGSDVDWVWIDEEPTGSKGYAIWQELLMRTIDRKGRLWLTLTPVSGMSWSYDQLYEASAYDDSIHVTEVQTYENSHIDRGELDKITKQLSQDELEMRMKGKYIQFSGLVYKEFERKLHVIPPFEIPKHWKKYRSIDHGINNPTACVFVAVNEKDELYVYDEYYETDKTIKENCENIRQITGSDKIEWTTIDPSTEARDPQTNKSDRQDYLDNGIATKALRTDRMNGINAVRQLLKVNLVTGRPRLFFFDTCPATIKEMARYRYKTQRSKSDVNASEEPVKVLDHALDALRYLVMSNPVYKYEEDSMPVSDEPWY